MKYFTWRENGLTSDCQSLQAMASRFEESANLMRRLANEGFRLERRNKQQRITHNDPIIFDSWGFVCEESSEQQLVLSLDEDC